MGPTQAPASIPTLLETVLRRDRFIVIGGLVSVIAAAWIWILLGAGTGLDATMMAGTPEQPMQGGMGGMAMGVVTPAV